MNERKRGFVEAVKDAGVYHPENMKEVNYQFLRDDIELAVSQLLDLPKKVDAIFFATNSISIAGIKSLSKRGLIIQRNIQVMCFDESEAIEVFPYRVPYIKQPIEEIAKKSLKVLFDQIDKNETNVRKFFLDAILID